MELPILSATAAKSNVRYITMERFEEALLLLQEGVANKHIWNVDYEKAKDQLSSVWEKAGEQVYAPLRERYYRGDWYSRPCDSWDSNDPRRGMGVVSLFNSGGFLKKLLKIKDAPELKEYMELMAEGAQVTDLIKAAKGFIEKGRKPSENPKEVDYSNTGLCSVCGKRHKLDIKENLVDHGYSLIRNWGGRTGICFGAKRKAWEISPEGAEAYILMMQEHLARSEDALENLKERNPAELNELVRVRKEFGRYENKWNAHLKGTPEYERVRKIQMGELSRDIGYLTKDIETFTERVKNWKKQPLQYGGAETQERWKSKLLKN